MISIVDSISSGYEYDELTKNILSRKFNIEEDLGGYVDLRNNFPQILSLDNLPFNPIISVVYLLHYQLLKNKLPIPTICYVYLS